MLDIIFISYDESNADANYAALKERFPHAKRVHRVRGIGNAHIAASKKSNTTFFYVVDADAKVLETFKFDYKPTVHEEKFVHIWHAQNPATGQTYGYGGIKLFSKKFFANIKTQLDFTTTLTKDIKIMPEVACITAFNADMITAFRGAFRESVKLYKTANNLTLTKEMRKEAQDRLDAWRNPIEDCDFRKFIIDGVESGIKAAITNKSEDLLFINDHDYMMSFFKESNRIIDLNTDPTPTPENNMKSELFFTTRIAAAMYDDFVINNLKIEELRDAISDGQLLSKNWLVHALKDLIADGVIPKRKDPIRIAILGGWIGTLSLMIFSWEIDAAITSIDLDDRANRIAQTLNYSFKFNTSTTDMYDIDYNEFDVIINTASEHIPDIPKWRDGIPNGKIVIIQNNNYLDAEGHVSTVSNSDELRTILRLSNVMYEGTKVFPMYSRFMLIGQT